MEIKTLEEKYGAFARKFKLPSFRELNENFEIEKIDRESVTLLRTIRKIMIDKIINSLGFLEMLLNSVNAGRMYMPFLKSMTVEDKEKINLIYNKLAGLSILSLKLEVEYSEKGEAELIRETFNRWNEVKNNFLELLKKIEKPDNNIPKKERTYFG